MAESRGVPDRRGYANGFKPESLKTRVGDVHLRIPQTRGYHDDRGRPFYPRSLERGVRSERAMTLAIAEMDVQGVSARTVTKIVEELCGLDITSTQVSRAAAKLDEQLAAWRNSALRLDHRSRRYRHLPCPGRRFGANPGCRRSGFADSRHGGPLNGHNVTVAGVHAGGGRGGR